MPALGAEAHGVVGVSGRATVAGREPWGEGRGEHEALDEELMMMLLLAALWVAILVLAGALLRS
jgi:hypothetical protein